MKTSRRTTGAAISSVLAPALSLVLGLTVLAGCSGDDDPDSSPTPSSHATPSEAPTFRVAPVVEVGRVVGRLSKKHRKDAEQQISRVVMRWVENAYLSTDPGTASDAFGGFTPRLRTRALHDRDVMSNAGIDGITRITPSVLHVTTDFLGVRGRPAGATSRILLRYKTIGDQRHHVTVGGRVSLVHDPRGWHVISYDVHRGVR